MARLDRFFITELLGKLGGALLSPLTGFGASLRRARLFHPEGAVYRATLRPLAAEDPLRLIGQRLSGPAILRISTALWRGGREWTDALGIALRLKKSDRLTEQPGPGDQDLLFATIRSPWTMLLAPLTTHQHDFLQNDYYAVSPFEIAGFGRGKVRLVSSRHRVEGSTRAERFDRAVLEGRAVFRLELRALRSRAWKPVAEITVEGRVLLDQESLRFSPFLAGRGIAPRGFIHALRHATYGSSQRLRPAGEGHVP